MASPRKPWERETTQTNTVAASLPSIPKSSSASIAHPEPIPSKMDDKLSQSSESTTSSGPPVPARSTAVLNATSQSPSYSSPYSRVGTYGGYGSGYGSSYANGYSTLGSYGGGYGGLGSYSRFGSGYGGYGNYYNSYGGTGIPGSSEDPNSLRHVVETGSQPAFALVRSVVDSCLSFAGMIESTFTATHSSFFAIMSLIEHFGNLRSTISSIILSVPLIRLLRSLVNKLLGRPTPTKFTAESFARFEARHTEGPRPSKKPLIFFILALFGLPYLMGRLIKALAQKQTIEQSPNELIDPKKLDFYQALYDFTPQDPTIEMPLKKGDIVAVLQKLEGGWWKGRKRDGSMGFVPGNHLDIIPRREELENLKEDMGKGKEVS